MDIISVILIAVGLAMDAFAVSIANGISMKKLKISSMLKFGISFGIAQAAMPVIGYYFASSFLGSIMSFANFIAFAVLSIIGGKMIYESFKHNDADVNTPSDISYKTLLVLAIATSIDAMIVGISFGLLKVAIMSPAVIIGIISFLFSSSGVFIGNKIGGAMKKSSAIFGGCILIFIGIKTLVS